jgi:hypothetical protein
MNEAQFQAKIIALCERFSIKYFHSTDPIKDLGPGFPDLVLVGTIVLFVELKTDGGVMSTRQRVWRSAIEGTTNGYHQLWRPADLASGVIERILRQMSPADLG